MTDHENHNWSYTCLETAESLILANPFAAKELAVETTAILLNMQNDCDVDEFTGLRHRALIAACLSNPETVSKYLADQFYEIRTVRHRLDILEVLMTSAQRLANPVAYVKPELSLSDDFLVPAAAQEQEKQWLTQVNERIKSNTRKIATVTKKVEARANGFLPHANSFFFPLIDRFGKLDIVYNLKSEDHYILGRFIYTLAIILSAASQGPVARQMGKRFLQFLWTFRYHVESYVRQAIIFGACVIFTSVPPIYLLEHLRDEVQELRQWLMDVSSGDSNDECVKRSLQAIFVLNEVIEQNSHQSQ
ncbi:Telomere length regulation protein TEL2 -like protein [Halotydeus destructor]|nr:Telomere length regulation protein TEL2 -like protein [Halotydeus destructor]